MPAKTPAFWYRKEGSDAPFPEKTLSVLSPLYQLGHHLIQKLKTPYKSSIPIICIGNAVVGGSGKTPISQSLANLILEHKITPFPCFLTRGYGGENKGPIIVNSDQHNAEEVGDEALLLAAYSPTIVSKAKVDGIKFIEKQDFSACILDDGLQNRSLHKNLNILVIDGSMGFGNKRTLPAGPLREGLEHCLQKSDAFILIGEDKRGVLRHLPAQKPLFKAKTIPQYPSKIQKDAKIIGFCGLGYPEKFKNTLLESPYSLVDWFGFPDHHSYSTRDLDYLAQKAKEQNAQLVTTQKDIVKIPKEYSVETIPIKIEYDNEAPLLSLLRSVLQ